ncbi:YchJ family protein [Psychromonas aquimarina]|uniref:YchJ family protein n=1 Tax=Psychromonas aquimarina TaxID=444919 RepID=UPI0003FCB24F|nr:YchJ family protein [Psychromonas aquimarina]
MTEQHQQACPCKSGKSYQQCCLPFHESKAKPETCEQLMRSRFSAFVLQFGAYLFSTYDADFRGSLTIEQLSEKTMDWKNLQIIASESLEKTGFVEFKAWYIENGRLGCHHERSNFVKKGDQWLYCDGTFYPEEKSGKIARNGICPCGSGKKYKRCCAAN